MRREARLLILIGLVLAGAWAFALIADAVSDERTGGFDEAVLLFFRTPGDPADPLGPDLLARIARDITALGGYPVLLLMTGATLGYLALKRHWRNAILVAFSVGGGIALVRTLKTFFDRARPDLVPHAVDVHTLSFPSAHSMLSAVVYLTLAVMLAADQANRRLKIYVIAGASLIAFLIGLSRVYLGVHWPTDVLAGWSVGVAWALFCRAGAEMLERRPEGSEGSEG